ncbi:MAG: site-2 protease family protein [Clostridia bacterium]|nr:site-2 protease family protein [Clostridia bacterium]
MLIDLLQSGFDKWAIVEILVALPVVLFALTVHEVSHGYAAYKLGDPTAYNFGRLTLNPAKHLDLMGTLCMLIAGFGWAKPVPVNARYFKNYKRDMAITAAAGPLSNFIMGTLGALLYGLVIRGFNAWLEADPSMSIYNFGYAVSLLFFYFSFLNFSLCFFNLIPIPPFDGSRILFTFLPDRLYFGIMKYERIIMIVLLVLLWTDIIPLPIGNISSFLLDKISSLVI